MDSWDELTLILGREPTYDEVMNFMDAKITGVEDFFLERVRRKDARPIN